MSEFKYKQVIAVRTDIKMSKGKLAAQVGHAAVSAADQTRKNRPEWWKEWIKEGQCKVVVKVKSEEELRKLELQAKEIGLPTALICDRGLTELSPGTITCLGIGPAPSEQIGKITRKLPLL